MARKGLRGTRLAEQAGLILGHFKEGRAFVRTDVQLWVRGRRMGGLGAPERSGGALRAGRQRSADVSSLQSPVCSRATRAR
jgi:hypothetical protein